MTIRILRRQHLLGSIDCMDSDSTDFADSEDFIDHFPFLCGVNVGGLLCGTSIESIESVNSEESIESVESSDYRVYTV